MGSGKGRRSGVEMDVKKLARQRLLQLETMEQAAQNLPGELARLRLSGAGEEVCLPLQQRLDAAQLWVDTTRQAMQVLSGEERLIAQRLFILPAKGNVQRLCQELGVEQSSVYRRRDRMLRKLGQAMFGEDSLEEGSV